MSFSTQTPRPITTSSPIVQRSRTLARSPTTQRSPKVDPADSTAPAETVQPAPSTSPGSGPRLVVDLAESVGHLPSTALSPMAQPSPDDGACMHCDVGTEGNTLSHLRVVGEREAGASAAVQLMPWPARARPSPRPAPAIAASPRAPRPRRRPSAALAGWPDRRRGPPPTKARHSIRSGSSREMTGIVMSPVWVVILPGAISVGPLS